jgi:hypothetical protein
MDDQTIGVLIGAAIGAGGGVVGAAIGGVVQYVVARRQARDARDLADADAKERRATAEADARERRELALGEARERRELAEASLRAQRDLADAESRRRIMLEVRTRLLEREITEADQAHGYVRDKLERLRKACEIALRGVQGQTVLEPVRIAGVACPPELIEAMELFDKGWFERVEAVKRHIDRLGAHRVYSDDLTFAQAGIEELETEWLVALSKYRRRLHDQRAVLEAQLIVPTPPPTAPLARIGATPSPEERPEDHGPRTPINPDEGVEATSRKRTRTRTRGT